jgi:hypothetical protein
MVGRVQAVEAKLTAGGNLDPLLRGIKRVANNGVLLPVPSPPTYVLNAVPPLQAANNPALGTIDVSLTPGPPNTVLSGPGVWVPNSTLFLSIVDIATSAYGILGVASAAASISTAIPFGATQANHFCTGARFYWAGSATTIKVSLWRSSDNARVANVSIPVAGAGIFTANFASPFALVAGLQYAVAMWDTSGAAYTYYNGQAGSGASPLGGFMPFSDNNGAALAGPFIEYVGATAFAGQSSASTTYGLQVAGDVIPTSNSTSKWSLIEPTVT